MANLATRSKPTTDRVVKSGVFRTWPKQIEGRVGGIRVAFERNAGGAFSLLAGKGGSVLGSVSVHMQLEGANGERLEVRQEADSNPDFYFLEEGPQRIGLRVLYRLYDQKEVYHGDGFQEVWIYPNGDLFCSVQTRLTDELAHAAVTNAWLEIKLARTHSKMRVGTPSPSEVDATTLESGAEFGFKDSLPGRSVVAEGKRSAVALHWLGEGGRAGGIYIRRETPPPFYHRWPTLYDQFYMGGSHGSPGWKAHDSGRLEIKKERGRPTLCLWWVKDSQVPANDWVRLDGIFAISLGRDAGELGRRVAARQDQLHLGVQGGVDCGYDDLEDCYMVRKTSNPVQVGLPRDAFGREARVKVFGLVGKGAVVVKVDGKEVPANLESDGGIVDDPFVPVLVQPHAPARECVLSVKLSPDEERALTVEEGPGVQLSYQSAYWSVDQRRNWVLFSDKCGERGGFEFSTFDGKARNICAYGGNREAVTELALFWFKDCGHSPQDYLNQTRDFQIIKNGPREVQFYYRGVNFSDRAQSEFWVTIPWRSDVLQMQMKCRFTVLETWKWDMNQFYDVFPHEGVYTEKWWYDRVLSLGSNGRVGMMHTRENPQHKSGIDPVEEKAFFAMYPSDRGNLLTLVKSIRPAGHRLHPSICGNYIDHHFDVEVGEPPIKAGTVIEADYDLALYGDGATTQEELLEIGRKSLEAGRFVLPRR